MNDQARALREAPPRHGLTPGGDGEAVVIGSGKGGVGKSLIAAALAVELARRGRRTLLVDGAQNQGNLHVLFGARPSESLAALAAGEVAPEDLLVPVAENLWLVPADSGAEATHGLTAVDRARLHHRLSGLFDRFDAVLVDAGPGIESVVRACAMRAARLVVIAVPEPAALSDAYALMKIVNLQVPALPHDVLVNRTQGEEGAVVHERLRLACERFLNRTPGSLGELPEDPAFGALVRRPGAVLDANLPALAALASCIEALTSTPADLAASGPPLARTTP